MFVRATKAFETPSHNLVVGAIVDLPEEQAKAAIARGDAVAMSNEDAIAARFGTQTATAVQPSGTGTKRTKPVAG